MSREKTLFPGTEQGNKLIGPLNDEYQTPKLRKFWVYIFG